MLFSNKSLVQWEDSQSVNLSTRVPLLMWSIPPEWHEFQRNKVVHLTKLLPLRPGNPNKVCDTQNLSNTLDS